MNGVRERSAMREEVAEQPAVVAETVARLREPADELAAAVRVRRLRGVLVLGRGTSANAALYARYLLEARAGLRTALEAPSLRTAYNAPRGAADVLLLAFSQSGETPEVVDLVERAREGGLLTAAVTSVADSPLARAAETPLVTAAGHERSIAATKSFTAQLAAVATLAAALGATELAAGLPTLGESVAAAIELGAAEVERAAPEFADAEVAACVARGFALCAAHETALKLKEAAGIWAEGYSSADLRHGPIAAMAGRPALLLTAGGALRRDLVELEGELLSRGARPVRFDLERLGAGSLPEELAPLPLVVPGQLLAERVARLRGLDPDRPPGLSKVTRTR